MKKHNDVQEVTNDVPEGPALATADELGRVAKVADCALTIANKIKDYLERVTGADIDGDGRVGRGPYRKVGVLLAVLFLAGVAVAGPANTNIAVWRTNSYVDASGNVSAPNITVLETSTGTLNTAVTALQTATNTLNTARIALEAGTNTLNTATNTLDTARIAVAAATNVLNVATGTLNTARIALAAATNYITDTVYGSPVIVIGDIAGGQLVTTNTITVKNLAGATVTDYTVMRVWLGAAANAVSHDAKEIQKVVDKQDYWIVVTNAGVATFTITEAAATTNTISASVGPNTDTDSIPLTD